MTDELNKLLEEWKRDAEDYNSYQGGISVRELRLIRAVGELRKHAKEHWGVVDEREQEAWTREFVDSRILSILKGER